MRSSWQRWNPTSLMRPWTPAQSTACARRRVPWALTPGSSRRFRRLRHSAAAQNMARRVAENFGMAEHAVHFGLRLGHAVQSVFGAGAITGITQVIRTFTGKAIPQWTADVPRPVRRRPATQRAGAQAVYFPSCISRVMGTLPDEPADMSAMEAFVTVAGRSGVPVFIPEDVEGELLRRAVLFQRLRPGTWHRGEPDH